MKSSRTCYSTDDIYDYTLVCPSPINSVIFATRNFRIFKLEYHIMLIKAIMVFFLIKKKEEKKTVLLTMQVPDIYNIIVITLFLPFHLILHK
jgi:hypothetical protein